jgi:hypothetical protein
MKAKPALDIDALVAEAVPPRPNAQLIFTIPLRVDSETNGREHWAKKHKRKKEQKDAILTAWIHSYAKAITLPCVVRFTRVGPKRLDDDNLAESFKACRDAVAWALHCDDGSALIKWEYEQCAVGKRVYQVRVEVY